MRFAVKLTLAPALALSAAPAVAADTAGTGADTVWVVTAGALVFFMQAGFALLESGHSRAKNAVNVVMKNYMDVCLGSLAFWVVGFGLMFGTNPTGLLGQDNFLLSGVEPGDYGLLFFQTMFAATAVTIASGAMAERTRFTGYLTAAVVVMAVIYPVYGSWVWGGLYEGGGWLAELGFVDFAGSTVVHSVGGWVALAGIIVLGPRTGRFGPRGEVREIPGHNLTLAALGGFILWLGWFGFNGGSTLAATPEVATVVLNTHLAASAGAAGAMAALKATRRAVLLTQVVNGSIGGLVAITAGAASMEAPFAAATGLVAGAVVVFGSDALWRLRLDDVVGAVPVHGFAGAWGTLAAGMFHQGDLFDPQRMVTQVIGILVAFIWAFSAALVLYSLVARLVGLRSDPMHEQRGLDYTEHAETGYPEFQNAPIPATGSRSEVS